MTEIPLLPHQQNEDPSAKALGQARCVQPISGSHCIADIHADTSPIALNFGKGSHGLGARKKTEQNWSRILSKREKHILWDVL